MPPILLAERYIYAQSGRNEEKWKYLPHDRKIGGTGSRMNEIMLNVSHYFHSGTYHNCNCELAWEL